MREAKALISFFMLSLFYPHIYAENNSEKPTYRLKTAFSLRIYRQIAINFKAIKVELNRATEKQKVSTL